MKQPERQGTDSKMLKIGNRQAAKTSLLGFTLVELLIALAILGIIAAFAIPKVLQAAQQDFYRAKHKELLSSFIATVKARAENGGQVNYYHSEPNAEAIEEDIINRFQVVKRCDNIAQGYANDCVPNVPCKPGSNCQGWDYSGILSDGSSMALTLGCHSSCTILTYTVLFDADGPSGPNALGEDRLIVDYSHNGRLTPTPALAGANNDYYASLWR